LTPGASKVTIGFTFQDGDRRDRWEPSSIRVIK
jgi:hypothetical protein